MLKTIKTNYRDIISFLIVGILCSVLLEALSTWSAYRDRSGTSIPGLAMFITLLTAFSRFVGANLCAWLLGIAVGWPLINRWGNDQTSFADAWWGLGPSGRIIAYMALFSVELIAASICFAVS